MLKKYFVQTRNHKVLQVYQERGKITLKIFSSDYEKAFEKPEAVAVITAEQMADIIQALRESGK